MSNIGAAAEHYAITRTCIRRPNVELDGIALARWFFRVADRRAQDWTSTSAARNCLIPVGRVHAAFVEARRAGLMELRLCEFWRWIGGDG